MEIWQKDHIRKTLPNLLRDTVCSSTFLASLYADGVISTEEIDILENIRNRQEQSKKFYEIVQTRKDSYNLLKQALKDTAQTGAFAILDKCSQHNIRIPFKNCGSISYFNDILLGRGCNNTRVYKGQFENRDVAVKRINIDDVELLKVLEEVNFLRQLDWHPNVVRYYKTEITNDLIYIALELCDVNLFDWVTKQPRTVEIDDVEVIKQVTEGVTHLHSYRVIHRDLKPTNVLLVCRTVGNTHVKISDFGLSKMIPVGASRLDGHTLGVGTAEWIAPEVSDGHRSVRSKRNVAGGMSFASDIFSLGCIYYFVLSQGLHPFGKPPRCQVNILDGKPILDETRLKRSNALGFIKLISKMISHKQGERPTVFEVRTWLPTVEKLDQEKINTKGQILNNDVKKSVLLKTSTQKIEEREGRQRGDHIVNECFSVSGIITRMESLREGTQRNNPTIPEKPKIFNMAKQPTDIDREKKKFDGTSKEALNRKLHFAIKRRDEQAIKELLESGADVNAKNSYSDAPVIQAATSKVDLKTTLKIIKCLIEFGANAFEIDQEGQTFLHKILSTGTTLTSSEFVDVTQYLVQKRLSNLFNVPENTLRITPLMLAARNVVLDTATISLLRRNNVDVNLVDRNGSSYLSYAADGNKNAKLITELLGNKNTQHKLIPAIADMDMESVKVLIRLGADVNEKNNQSDTPLHIAADSKNKSFAVNIIKFLIDSGANVYAKDEDNWTFLHRLVGYGTTINPTQFNDIVTFLISKNLPQLFNAREVDEVTPFQWAVEKVEVDTTTLNQLKNNGVDFNAVDIHGQSVLYYATWVNRTSRLIFDLVTLGADPKLVTKHKTSVLHGAAHNGNVELLKFFLNKGLDVNARDCYGQTPLHYAIRFHRNVFKTVQFLLRIGARSDIVDDEGKSPHDYFKEEEDKHLDAFKISTCFSRGSFR